MHVEDIDTISFEDIKITDMAPEAIIESALEQSDGGGTVVTVALPDGLGPDRAAHIIRSIQTQSDRPLVLVCNDLGVLDAALREIPGSPAVACPGCSKKELSDIASKYGALAI
jgi:hypothetical protein